MEILTRNAFLLRHLASGNSAVFEEYKFTRKTDEENSYHGLTLQMLVSEFFIDTAIKFRIILDVLRDQDMKYHGKPEFEDRFEGRNSVGQLIPDGNRIKIREACNKIIHAKKVKLQWIVRDKHEFWDGNITLLGNKGRSEWQCLIATIEFCQVLELYIGEIEQVGDYYGSWHEN